MRASFSMLCVCASILVSCSVSSKPPMGWGSYNAFGVHANDAEVRATADAMVSLGLRELGYTFLNLDDQWQAVARDSKGRLQADPAKFPHGMKSLADYTHARGLLFGLYSDAGPVTCSGTRPGHLGHEVIDATTFAEWGVDYLKSDNCYPQGKGKTNVDKYEVDILKSIYEGVVTQSPQERVRYQPMMAAIESVRTIRNITFELCLYGWDHVEQWASISGDYMWRASEDIHDTWESIMYNIDCLDTDRFYDHSGPATGWSYGDSLQVGHSLSEAEYRSHFALWCAVKSPLMIGFDLRGRARNDSSVLTVSNAELIGVNQDALGKPARCVKGCTSSVIKVKCGEWWGGSARHDQGTTMNDESYFPPIPSGSKEVELWSGPLAGGAHVVIVVNRADNSKGVSFNWLSDAKVPKGRYYVHDMWQHKVVANATSPGLFTAVSHLPSHAHLALRLDPAW